MAQSKKHLKKAIGIAVVLVLSVMFQTIVSGTAFQEDALAVWVFDIGQGDAIFIDGPLVQVLIDGGPDGSVLEKLSAVMPFWDHDIDLLINSHPHKDHVEGLAHVLERYDVSAVWDSGQEYGTDTFAYYQQLSEPIHNSTHAGETYDLGGGAVLTVLWPAYNVSDQRLPNPHDGNVTVLLTYGDTTVLLTGDMESEVEAQIVDELPHIDVLKVGHHGSLTSTSPELLQAITPDYAVISVGADNDYGHPHPVILDRLQRAGVRILRTDEDGDVRIRSTGAEPEVTLFHL